jgi:orotidine-5'-phosphate decarboxylase
VTTGVAVNFADRLIARIRSTRTPLIVGLDPRREQLPPILRDSLTAAPHSAEYWEQTADAYREFSCGIIDVVADLVPAIKPQLAFFEQLGPAGLEALSAVVDHAANLVILDGKRNDIGSTGEAYAAAYLGRKPRSPWGGDALTINPWMGRDSLAPFVARCAAVDAGLFVLVKTSNPGSEDYQALNTGGQPVYRRVAADVENLATQTMGNAGYGSVGAVIGATYPQQLAELRAEMPHTLFLIPGFGAQGGTASDVAAGFDRNGLGAIVNSSRAIIFAHENKAFSHLPPTRWQEAVEAATRQAIAQLRAETPASAL